MAGVTKTWEIWVKSPVQRVHEISKAIAWQLGHLSESQKYQVSSGKSGTTCGYLLIVSIGQKREGPLTRFGEERFA